MTLPNVISNLYSSGSSLFNACYKAWDIALYATVAFIIALLALCAYVKIKYKFWALQPVMHVYDIQYWFFKRGIIRKKLPEKNKYCNFKSIETITFDKASDPQLSDLMHLIQTNYLRNAGNVFAPSKQHIVPYFTSNHTPAYWSFYWEEMLIQNKSDIINHKQLIGCITSRPLHVTIHTMSVNSNGNNVVEFDAYYIDYLCIHKNHRKKGIAPELIQTHEYNQSHRNLSIQVSLFKRENELTGIVPLCAYDTYIFSMHNWCAPVSTDASINVVRCGKDNLKYVIDLLSKKDLFDIIIVNSIGNFTELIQTSNIYVYMMICADEIVGAYFFRNPCISIEKGKKALSCFASIFNRQANCIEHNKQSRERWLNMFVHGFKIALTMALNVLTTTQEKNEAYHYIVVERIGHNSSIVDDLLIKTAPYSVSSTAYFFYNFAYPTFNPDNVLILS
jgi:hypothetical protein